MRDLEEVRSALVAELGGEERLPMVNARLILRTGVSLTKIDPKTTSDAPRIAKVVSALREMGFALAAAPRGARS